MIDAEAAPTQHRGPVSWTRSLASGSTYLFGATLAANTGFFAAVLVLTRALDPAQRGTVAFVIVTALFAAYLGGLGLGEAAMVFASTRPESRPRLLTNLLLASALASIAAAGAVYLILEALAGVRPSGISTLELLLLGVGVVATALFENVRAFLLGCSQFRSQALVHASWPWVYAGVLLIVSLTRGLSVVVSITCWVVCFGAAALTLIAIAVRHSRVGRPDAQLFRSSMHFGLRAWAVGASRFLNFRADQILMGFLTTQAALGIYAVAVSASEALLYLPFAIGSAIVPIIGGSKESERAERTLRTLRALLLTTVAAVAVAAAAGPALLPAVFGHLYEGAVVPFLCLLPGAVGFAAVSVLGGALVAAGRPGRASIGFVVATFVGLALDVIMIPPLHATGAAVAASVAFIAGGYASIVSFRRTFNAPWSAFVPGKDDLRSVVALANSRPLQRLRGGHS